MPSYTGSDDYTVHTLRASGVSSVSFSSDSSRIYAARADGTIDVFDAVSHTHLTNWAVGESLRGMSLSEDGSFLLAVEYDAVTKTSLVHRVSTSTGAVQDIAYAGHLYDVEVVDADTAILTGTQNVTQANMRLDLITGTFSPLAGSTFYSGSGSVLVEDGHLTLIAEPGTSNGPLFLYDDVTDTIVAADDNYQPGVVSGFNWGSQAVSEAAGLVVQSNNLQSINIYDLSLHAITNVVIEGPLDGLAFSQDGQFLYARLAWGTDVVKYDVDTWNVVERFSVGPSDWHNNVGFGDQIHFSADGSYMTVLDYVDGTLKLIDLSARNEAFNGTVDADSFDGRGGNDRYVVNHAGDIVVEREGDGHDRVIASISYALSAGAAVEDLRLADPTGIAALDLTGSNTDNAITGNDGTNTLSGRDGADVLAGRAGDDTLLGGAGNDLLDGGTGTDAMEGGAGNDSYVVDSVGDTVTEAVNRGTDEVRTRLGSYTLGANLENLVGTSAAGQSLTGNAQANALTGGAGADILDGAAGFDRMAGGRGNDTYVVDSSGDQVVEGTNAGTDAVRTGLSSYFLAANVENLIGTSAAGQTLTGNSLANAIAGGSGNDVIVGGAGADTMAGGQGDDIYLVENAGDQVVEASTAGTDEVHTDLAGYALRANVENLRGTSALGQSLTGNELANTIVGHTGNDRLSGGAGDDLLTGGAGNDVLNGQGGSDAMQGGAGDDTYYVDAAGDVVVEAAGGGVDKVSAAIDYVLGDDIEALTLVSGARAGTGNALANAIFGSSGADAISGLAGDDVLRGNAGRDAILGGDGADLIDGGAGKDTLTGDAGRDVFQFRDGDFGATRALADTITDFSQADKEKISLNLVDADTVTTGNQAFAWIGNEAFTGVAGQLHYAQAGGNTYVEGDLNGDGTADFVIALTGLINLTASDFVL